MKIASVVVTFNRKELLLDNIRMQLKQKLALDSIIIVDNNSTDGTYELLKQQGIFENDIVDYQRLESNTGGAGGFYYGSKYAFEKGFDFIILMDDDGKPFDEDTLEILVDRTKKVYAKNKNLLINSIVTYDGKNVSFGEISQDSISIAQENNDLMDDICAPFNSTLVTKETFNLVGFPRKDFFMSCDEREFVRRCVKSGVYIATEPRSVYLHPKTKDPVVPFKGKKVELLPNPNKEYYYLRNTIATGDKGIKYIPRAIKHYLIRMQIINALEDQKSIRRKLCTKALFDGLFGRMGRRV